MMIDFNVLQDYQEILQEGQLYTFTHWHESARLEKVRANFKSIEGGFWVLSVQDDFYDWRPKYWVTPNGLIAEAKADGPGLLLVSSAGLANYLELKTVESDPTNSDGDSQ